MAYKLRNNQDLKNATLEDIGNVTVKSENSP